MIFFNDGGQTFNHWGHFMDIQLNTIGFTFPGYFFPKTIIQNMEKNSDRKSVV